MAMLEELKRRNVIKAATIYIVVSWLLLQISTTIEEALNLPAWFDTLIIALLALGFPVVVLFSWLFEITPEGIKKESEVNRTDSITAQTAARLNKVIILLLTIAIGLLGYQQFSQPQPFNEPKVSESIELPAGQTAADQTSTSLAVLPFVNMSQDPSKEPFSDGLTEELLNKLVHIPNLLVTGRTSSFQFKGKNQDLREIGKQLDVEHILEGSVRWSGENMRITAQLIKTSDGSHLWSETYDRKEQDIFSIQDEIAQNVSDALGILLDENARARLLNSGTKNIEAFILYQQCYQGNIDAHNFTGTDKFYSIFEKINQYCKQALELDNNIGSAYQLMADYYSHLVFDNQSIMPNEQAFALYTEQLRLALKTNATPLQKLIWQAELILFSDDWSRLPIILEQTLNMNGCHTSIWFDYLIVYLADTDKSYQLIERSMQCNPLDPTARFTYLLAAENALDYEKYNQAKLDWAVAGYEVSGSKPLAFLLNSASSPQEQMTLLTSDYKTNPGAEILLAALNQDVKVYELLKTDNTYYKLTNELLAYTFLDNKQKLTQAIKKVDQLPWGSMTLMIYLNVCMCGIPFDLDDAPNFKQRIAESFPNYKPLNVVEYPLIIE